MPKVIDLEKPLAGHAGPIRSITLREPVFRDLIEVGAEPETVIYTGTGAFFVQENLEAISKYLDRLVMDGDAAVQIPNLSLRDSLKVRKAVVDFFREATTSEGKPTSSSSPSDGTPVASPA